MIAKSETAQHSTALHCTAQHSTAQHCTAQHSTALHSTQVLPLTTVIPSPFPLNTTREELLAQKESLETQDKQIKEKDAIIKKLRELGKNYRAKFEASRKEVDELKGSLSSQEQVGGVGDGAGRGARVLGGRVLHVCVGCVCAAHVCWVGVVPHVCVGWACMPHVCLGWACLLHVRVGWAWYCTCVGWACVLHVCVGATYVFR